MTKEEVRDNIQSMTYNDVLNKLLNDGICNMVRPVGFGKTYLLSRLAERSEFKNIVYFYPNSTVRMQSIGDSCKRNIIYVSYNMFARYVGKISTGEFAEKVLNLNNVSDTLFIFDESHFVGAKRCSVAFEELYGTYKNGNYFIGSTATSIRDKSVDVTSEYFRGKQPFYYDTNKGMKDGLYKPIKCFYCNFNTGSLPEGSLEENDGWSRLPEDVKLKYQNFIRNKLLKVSRIDNAWEVYRDSISSVYKEEQNYMRFLVFFLNYEIMEYQRKFLVEDFKRAFPGKNIRIISVSSVENLMNLSKLEEKDNCIDLILSVDLLQHGYHDSKLNGVIMFRGTSSEIVYSQSVLRGLSVMSDYNTIVIDMLGSHEQVSKVRFKPVKQPSYVFRNSGGVGNIDEEFIEVNNVNISYDNLYDLTQIDRIKRAVKLDALVKSGIMPVEIACRELGLKSTDMYEDFLKLVDEAKEYLI